MDLPLSMRRKQLSTVLLLLSLILACLDGSAVVRAGEPPAVKLVDEALVSLGFTPGRVIAANNLGSPVVAASKDSQGAKLTVSVYYFPDYASLAASDWNKTLAEQANVDVGAGGWARARQNNSLRSEGSGSQQTWTPKGVGGVDFVCGGLMTSVGCVLESSARLKDQAQAKTEMARLGGEAEEKALDLAKQAAGAFADRQLCAGEVKKLPIIFLAGIAGSRLSDSNSGELWPLGLGDRSWLALNPDGNTPAFSSAKIVPNGIFYDQELQSMLGGAGWFANTPWPRRYQFAYDWRLDNTSQVQALAKKVSEVLFDSGEKKVILIAHSMGGLIARAYINTSGADKVDTLITINTPFYGAPKA
jgi:pimeloyl-ACP methyl ester carboxylesterase